MKKNIIYIILISIFISIGLNSIQAEEQTETCKGSTWFELYKCRVNTVCKEAPYNKENWNESSKIFKTIEYKTPEEYKEDPDFWVLFTSSETFFPLEMAKRDYRENQNNIYKCWVLQAQEKSFNLIKELIKIDKTWAIKDLVDVKIQSKLAQIEISIERNECSTTKDFKPSKKQILDQSTLEMCKYVYYLDFLKDYYNDIKNIAWITDEDIENLKKEKVNVIDMSIKRKKVLSHIDEEIEHTYNIYSIAFNAYSEYESFLPIHIGLEIVKEDFIVYRQKLYQTINPINQVVYKIINAMSK